MSKNHSLGLTSEQATKGVKEFLKAWAQHPSARQEQLGLISEIGRAHV